jgi:ABC-type uncharacterized transport system substrate-binding protein
MKIDGRQSAIGSSRRFRVFSFALCALLFALSESAHAQPVGKIFRIGYLDLASSSGSAVLVNAFREEMSKLGWIEGKNFTIEYRFAEYKSERLPNLAAELVRLKVDLIVSTSASSALAAKGATTSIPIVMANTSDPVGAGLVTNLARPSGNLTGFTTASTELNTKRLEVLKDAVPKLTRVGLLRPPGPSVGIENQLKELRPASLALKLKLEEIETAMDTKGLESGFQTAKQKHVGGIMTVTSPRIFAERKRIVELARKYRLPAIYYEKVFVDEGGLMSYGSDYGDNFRKSAHYVDQILKGAKPGDLPVQQASKFEFIINLKAAKQIGLTIPVRVLERANQVIK